MCCVISSVRFFLVAITVTVSLHSRLYEAKEIQRRSYLDLPNVKSLANDTFESETATGRWFVIFYRSSCGGCKMYLPFFEEVVKNVADWPQRDTSNPLVRLGSVDCETIEGGPVCLRYNVTGVPALRFFPGENKKRVKHPLGVTLQPHKNVTSVVRDLVKEILRETEMVPSSSSSSSGAITVESNSSFENTLIILEFQKRLKHEMKSFVNPSATRLSIRKPNGGVIMSGSPQFVRAHLRGQEENTEKASATTANYDRDNFYKSETPVYAIDIFRGLSAIFESDMIMFSNITGEERSAVLELLSLLEKILPASETYRKNLTQIRQWVSEHKEFSGVDWLKALNKQNFPLTQADYEGCRGSELTYRGYPCALWTIFHALTVSQCERETAHPDLKPTAVVHAMNRFLPRFFSCLECAYHFALNSRVLVGPNESAIPTNRAWPNTSEYTNYAPLESLPPIPQTCDDQILWLNAAHNGVNQRLQGQPTEDPQAPKVDYPPRTICADCWSQVNGKWVLGETPESKAALLQFLKRHYSAAHWELGTIDPVFIRSEEHTFHTDYLGLPPVSPEKPFANDLLVISIVTALLTILALVILLFLSRAIWRCRKKRPSYSSGRLV